ncbi:MAG: hypothetical protein GY820_35805 [Gammaproteobacteria bacterium]|nr:hypothetical protein [Gammaproteobacteria bacterium]
MKYIDENENDDQEFLEIVQEVISGTIEKSHPDFSLVLKMDNWFGEKWLGFSHVVMGAFGVAYGNLSIPPFVPERVISQSSFIHKAADDISVEALNNPLHIHQTSEGNKRGCRKIDRAYPSGAFFWWSGNTKKNGRGCLMSYLPSENGHHPWYVGFAKSPTWSIKEVKGISRTMLELYRNAA